MTSVAGSDLFPDQAVRLFFIIISGKPEENKNGGPLLNVGRRGCGSV